MNPGKRNSIISIGVISMLLAIMVMAGCGSPSATSITSAQVETIELDVSAAASLTDALQAVNELYLQQNKNVTIVANFASSGTLQKQIEQGAPADIFISAGAKQMQALQDSGLLVDETRQNLLSNKVVLAVPVNSTLAITDFTGLTDENVKQIAIGDPASVPAGTYGKAAFDQLGIYEQIESKLILCADVKQVLSYVEAGNVDAGIVYATDAAISTNVKVIAEAPAEVNAKIIYPIAVIKGAKNVEASQAYINFLFSSEAKAIFEKYGFVVVKT